jgi:cytochrome c oxidase subunit 2
MNARRHFAIAAAIWAVLSAVGVAAVVGIRILPVIASREAEIVDRAFVVLTVASIPVLMLVVVAIGYSVIRFRSGGPEDEGPAVRGHRLFEVGWVVISLVAVLLLAAYGTAGLLDIRGSQSAEFEVRVMATQWKWSFEYPVSGVKSKDLVLPADVRIRFTLESDDVIHSFYVPAFGIKSDVVPGRKSELYVTVTEPGTYGVQCAELCGFGHTRMMGPVQVLELAEFDAWLSDQKEPPAGG